MRCQADRVGVEVWKLHQGTVVLIAVGVGRSLTALQAGVSTD